MGFTLCSVELCVSHYKFLIVQNNSINKISTFYFGVHAAKWSDAGLPANTSYKLQHAGCIIHGWVNELWVKKYHIDEMREPRGVILCVGCRVPFISNAFSWHLMHDTWTEISNSLLCQITTKMCLIAYNAVKWSISDWNIFRWKVLGGEKKRHPWCTLWWTLHKSHLSSAGGDSVSVRCDTKQISHGTGSLWWWKALLIETTECRKTRWIMTW